MKIRPYQICVSGAAAGDTVKSSAKLAYMLGREIAKQGHVLLTGATIGLPYHAALGAKAAGGLSVGFSPASSYREHVKIYKLPTDAIDFINYTGMHYVGRDNHLVHSSEAIITVGGRIGSLHEFATAIVGHKVCGVLLGSGGFADFVPLLVDRIVVPGKERIIYDNQPARLVQRVVDALDERYSDFDDPSDRMRNYAKSPDTDREG